MVHPLATDLHLILQMSGLDLDSESTAMRIKDNRRFGASSGD
jgi:hypothetical protein